MSCPEERISAWIDDELSAEDARSVEAHVATCRRCRELTASFRSWSLPETAPDPGFIVRFRERRDALSVAPWWTWRQLALRLVPVAAAMLLAAVVALSMSSTSAPDSALQELENEALGAPVALDNRAEPVLSIAFEPFPEEIP